MANLNSRLSCVIVGIETHICVTQTALDLLHEGHKVYVIADGVSSCNKEEIPVALARLRSEGVVVTTSESWMYECVGDAGIEESVCYFHVTPHLVPKIANLTKCRANPDQIPTNHRCSQGVTSVHQGCPADALQDLMRHFWTAQFAWIHCTVCLVQFASIYNIIFSCFQSIESNISVVLRLDAHPAIYSVNMHGNFLSRTCV